MSTQDTASNSIGALDNVPIVEQLRCCAHVPQLLLKHSVADCKSLQDGIIRILVYDTSIEYEACLTSDVIPLLPSDEAILEETWMAENFSEEIAASFQSNLGDD